MNHSSRRTPLYTLLKERGGKMVPFAGYDMPLQFSGIKAEHHTVRTAAGLFDVGHMTEFWLEGKAALEAAHRLVTNDILSLEDGQVAYSPMCLPSAGIVDDLLVYRYSSQKVLIVANAANHDKDFKYLQDNIAGDVTLVDRSYQTGQIALQGPRSAAILSGISGGIFENLGYFHFAEGEVAGERCLVSRTGYTGEDGFEIYGSEEQIVRVFHGLEKAGEPMGMQLVGLGARDTLRLEAKLCLYGNDIDETTSPLEAGLGWTVKFDAGDFIGRDALLEQKNQGISRRLKGFEMIDRAIARHGYPIVPDGADADAEPMGEVTSGGPSPTLDKNIGLVYLPSKKYKVGATFGVVVRGKVKKAKVIKTPFYKRMT
ncbi:MAG: glycine cleavage system aminomethyltransferase GcvT [Proteobacteria bacterium]|nr:glycine cleavage system aminomethyltransferase GcvT [Pseudomonadota bacterium]